MLATIKAGDKVTILRPNGLRIMRDGKVVSEYAESTGRAVMRGEYGWVLNMGGRHGTPGIATAENIVKVTKGKR